MAGYADLQIKIRKIGVNVSKLCDKSAITVGKFKQTSRTVLVDLQASYQFLLDGMEDIAIVTLQSIATVAVGMAEAAEQLANAFDDEHARVELAHAETLQTKSFEEKQKEAQERKAKKIEIEQEKVAKQKAAAEQNLAFHEQEYKKAEARQTALEAPSDGVLDLVFEFFTGRKTVGARAAREEKERHLQDRKKQGEIRSKALQDFAEFSKQLENLSEMNSLTEAAIDSLHNAMGGLKALAGIMRKISIFWTKLEDECKQLGGQDMERMIQATMRRDIGDRAQVWGSPGFKQKAIYFYIRWVALGNVCETYYDRIKVTQRELYKYLEENLTTKEARQNIKSLAVDFSKEIEVAQKAIADKETPGQREMLALVIED